MNIIYWILKPVIGLILVILFAFAMFWISSKICYIIDIKPIELTFLVFLAFISVLLALILNEKKDNTPL